MESRVTHPLRPSLDSPSPPPLHFLPVVPARSHRQADGGRQSHPHAPAPGPLAAAQSDARSQDRCVHWCNRPPPPANNRPAAPLSWAPSAACGILDRLPEARRLSAENNHLQRNRISKKKKKKSAAFPFYISLKFFLVNFGEFQKVSVRSTNKHKFIIIIIKLCLCIYCVNN